MSAPPTAVDPVVEKFRDEITGLDRQLVALFNERLQAVRELWRYKEEHGLSFHDAGREAWLRDHLAAGNAGPLSADGLAELHRYILDLTKREVERG